MDRPRLQPGSARAYARGPHARWPWWLALAGCALDLAAFWPGQVSFDAAYAWWQARHGATLGVTPAAFVLGWRVSDWLGAGPELLFTAQLLLFWSGLALLAQSLRWPAARGACALAGIALLPLPWLLRSHVWTDVGLLAALTCALGLLARAQTAQRRWPWLAAALPCLAWAALLRHNALPASVPLLGYWAALAVSGAAGCRRRWLRIVALTGALLLALAGGARVLDAGTQGRVPLWPSLAQFDLAGISVQTQRMWLPAFMIDPRLDIAELTRVFRPWSNLSLFDTRHGMRSPFEPPLTRAELHELRHAWLDAISNHPAAWLAHRWRVTRALVGTHRADWPVELSYVDAQVRYRDTPVVAPNRGWLHRLLMQAAASLRTTPLLAAWPYLLTGLLALAPAWRRRRHPAGRLALVALASAWLLALPLTLLAPAAELRYLGWPCVASLIALALVLATPVRDTR